MSRLGIVYTCISKLTPRLSAYLQDEHKNRVLYRSKPEELQLNLGKTLVDTASLARIFADIYQGTEDYQLLTRALREQDEFSEDGSVRPKNKKEITSDSLQNSSDLDATFRSKSGEFQLEQYSAHHNNTLWEGSRQHSG